MHRTVRIRDQGHKDFAHFHGIIENVLPIHASLQPKMPQYFSKMKEIWNKMEKWKKFGRKWKKMEENGRNLEENGRKWEENGKKWKKWNEMEENDGTLQSEKTLGKIYSNILEIQEDTAAVQFQLGLQ